MGAAAAGITTALSAGAQLYGAFSEGKNAKLEGQIRSIRYQTQAEAGKVRAIQVQGAYADDLNTSLANIVGITAAQGRGVDSATSLALADRASEVSSRIALTAASNERLKAMGAEADARAAERAGAEAERASYLKMVGPGLRLAQEGYGLSKSARSLF